MQGVLKVGKLDLDVRFNILNSTDFNINDSNQKRYVQRISYKIENSYQIDIVMNDRIDNRLRLLSLQMFFFAKFNLVFDIESNVYVCKNDVKNKIRITC